MIIEIKNFSNLLLKHESAAANADLLKQKKGLTHDFIWTFWTEQEILKQQNKNM